MEKGKQTPPTPPTPPAGGAITLDAISKLIDEKLSGVQSSITEINANKAAASRRELFVAELDNAKIEGRPAT